jgi:hypothetical protein
MRPTSVGSWDFAGIGTMNIKQILVVLVLLLAISLPGCSHYGCGCPPKHLFSWIDRNCFVADWMNDHSCTSCHCPANHCPPDIVEKHPDLSANNPVPSPKSR